MGSIELVEVGHKYGTVYVIPSQLDSYVIFDKKTKTKTIHQVLNNTNDNYVVTLSTIDDKEFEFTIKVTNIYTYENQYEKEQINNLQFDIQNSDSAIVIETREFKKGTVKRKDSSTANESIKQIEQNDELTSQNTKLNEELLSIQSKFQEQVKEIQELSEINQRLSLEVQECKQLNQSQDNCTTELQRIETLLSSDTCTTELEKINIERSKQNKELTFYKNLCNMYHYSFLVLFTVCCIFYFVRYNKTNKL
jgi:hypothetical protein